VEFLRYSYLFVVCLCVHKIQEVLNNEIDIYQYNAGCSEPFLINMTNFDFTFTQQEVLPEQYQLKYFSRNVSTYIYLYMDICLLSLYILHFRKPSVYFY
jgi:hypothetical protein